jgi:hypothetical protein
MYFVSRQKYWPEGTPVVEVCSGGRDFANPDMLVPKYPGEGREYLDPREAVEEAIKIRDMWAKDHPSEPINLGVGNTGGFTMPFEAVTFGEKARDWAREQYEKLPKCDRCGEIIIPKEKCTNEFGVDFCSERCAELCEEEAEADEGVLING